MASNFLENPEENIQNLENLIDMLDELPPLLAKIGFKLITASVNEILKDIIPSYKIDHHNQDNSEVLQKKGTMKLQKYENALLQCAKSHLMKLEVYVKNKKDRETDIALKIHSLR